MLRLQRPQQVHHLGLDGDVERAGRLVQHHQAGLEDQGAGDGDALALAAAELVRVAGGGGGIEPDLLQRLGHGTVAGGAGEAGLVDLQPLADDLPADSRGESEP